MKDKKNKVPMKVIIPNVITSASVFCGVTSLIMTYHDKFMEAAVLLCLAAFFDLMDGRAARKLGGCCHFGEELDSLADAISFGVAPAFLMYAKFIDIEFGIWGAMAASFFALCAVLRLARFNVANVPSDCFQGLPSPAAGLTLAFFVMADFPLTPLLAVVVMALTGALMVSSLPFCNTKRMNKHNVNKVKMNLIKVSILIGFVIMKEKFFLVLALMYIATGLLRFDITAWIMLPEVCEKDEVCS